MYRLETSRRSRTEVPAGDNDLWGRNGGKTDNFEELYGRLQVVMDSLPPKCKEIFILGCVEGLSYKEVAEQLGVSVNTVKTQVKVAYKKIKSEFGNTDKNFMLILCNSFFKR